MEKLQQQLSEFEKQLLDSSIYENSSKDKLKKILQDQGATKIQLEKDEAEWLELSDELEAF